MKKHWSSKIWETSISEASDSDIDELFTELPDELKVRATPEQIIDDLFKELNRVYNGNSLDGTSYTFEYEGIRYEKRDYNGELCDSPLFDYIGADVAGASMAEFAGGNFADNLTAKFVRKSHIVNVTITIWLNEEGQVKNCDFTFFSPSLFERRSELIEKAKTKDLAYQCDFMNEHFEFGNQWR